MANLPESSTKSKKGGLVQKVKKNNTGVDLTPMVDLGFLLITFFMFATTLAQPKAVKFRMPIDDLHTPLAMDKEKTLVLIADSAQEYFGYEPLTENIELKKLATINTLRDYIIAKKKKINPDNPTKAAIAIVLKIHPKASYKNLISFLDEMTINNVDFYIVDKIKTEETKALADYGK
jgi:biopolymer transport protein ExbD